jgi:predicted CXXCH cytochrome family protein
LLGLKSQKKEELKLKTKTTLLSLAFVALLGTVLVGCNQQQPTPTPQEQTGEQPAPTTAQYVGSQTCSGCHAEYHANAVKTQHFGAFKPLSDFPLDKPAGQITVFDALTTDAAKSGTIDLSQQGQVYGVMMDHYVIAKAPAGFKEETYRVAALEKVGDKYTVKPAKEADVNKDGTPDWSAESFTCGKCHAPGIGAGSKDLGISCESCHGPGGNHVTAADKKGTMISQVATDACNTCHQSNPSKDKEGNWTANTHYGTRNYFASKHSQSPMLNDCQTCHESHKVNANGSLLRTNNPQELCATCHTGAKFDLDKLMWKNPTDARGHFTKDHSFGAIPYADLGDDPNTPPIEIKNQKVIDLITKLIPDAAK